MTYEEKLGRRTARIKNESNTYGNQHFEYNVYTQKVERYPGKPKPINKSATTRVRNKDLSKDDRFLGWL